MKFLFGESFPVFTGGGAATGAAIIRWGDAGNIAFAAFIGTIIGILIKSILWDMVCKKRVAQWISDRKNKK